MSVCVQYRFTAHFPFPAIYVKTNTTKVVPFALLVRISCTSVSSSLSLRLVVHVMHASAWPNAIELITYLYKCFYQSFKNVFVLFSTFSKHMDDELFVHHCQEQLAEIPDSNNNSTTPTPRWWATWMAQMCANMQDCVQNVQQKIRCARIHHFVSCGIRANVCVLLFASEWCALSRPKCNGIRVTHLCVPDCWLPPTMCSFQRRRYGSDFKLKTVVNIV